MEYAEITSVSIFVRFRLIEETLPKKARDAIQKASSGKKPVYVVIWTTTPWTLPGNVAIALHPKRSYAVDEAGGSAPERRPGTLARDELGAPISSLAPSSVDALFLVPRLPALDASSGDSPRDGDAS